MQSVSDNVNVLLPWSLRKELLSAKPWLQKICVNFLLPFFLVFSFLTLVPCHCRNTMLHCHFLQANAKHHQKNCLSNLSQAFFASQILLHASIISNKAGFNFLFRTPPLKLLRVVANSSVKRLQWAKSVLDNKTYT